MEKSPARVTRDLSAPWLRHSGRDDCGGVTSSAEMTVLGPLLSGSPSLLFSLRGSQEGTIPRLSLPLLRISDRRDL
jgi:hypothetical protein